MRYFIDSADPDQIEDALSLGVCGVTANPTMYRNCGRNMYDFLRAYAGQRHLFLSGEVMGDSAEAMWEEVRRIREIDPDIVIKINFGREGLRLCGRLAGQGIRTAVTLIFGMTQAVAAIEAGADYVFPFIGRTDEYGEDGMALVTGLQRMVDAKGYPTRVVAASVKNVRQLKLLAEAGVDYAAVSYELLLKSLEHPLTEQGLRQFKEDWRQP